MMKRGDRLVCKKTINNIFGNPLFEKDKEYNVLYIDNEQTEVMIVLNHNLYGNEYMQYPITWVNENFKKN